MNFFRTLGAFTLVVSVGCATMGQDEPVANEPPATPEPAVTTPTEPTQVLRSEPGVIPVGQLMDVRLQDRLSSETATVEQEFEATTVVDLVQDGTVLVPAGSVVSGVVNSVEPAGNIDRSGELTLTLHELEVGTRIYDIKAMPTQAFASGGIREEGATVGAGGAVGAIVGGIIGGLRGALIGAAVGAGGVIAATEGKDIVLPPGTIMRIRMDAPVDIRSGG
jgi:hypothetical protein